MYGGIFKGSLAGVDPVFKAFTSGADGAANDFVNLESGVLEIASAGDELVGTLVADMEDGDTGVLVNITPFATYLVDNDNDSTTFAATHVGGGFDLTGGTGAQLVDTSTVAQTAGSISGQLICLEYNPQGFGFDSDVSIGLFKVNEPTF